MVYKNYYQVPEGVSDRTTIQYNAEYKVFDILVNGNRIHSMNEAQFDYFCYTVEPAQENRYQNEEGNN